MRWLGWFSRKSEEDAAIEAWRAAWAAAAEMADRRQVEALRAQLAAAGLDHDEREIEREMLEGLEALVALKESIGPGLPPAVATGHRAVGRDECYFVAPASLPDDPAQPGGTLLLTKTRAIFVGGAKALTIPWHSVAVCRRQERDVVFVRTDRPDLHRLRCNTFGEALRAVFLARHLTARRI